MWSGEARAVAASALRASVGNATATRCWSAATRAPLQGAVASTGARLACATGARHFSEAVPTPRPNDVGILAMECYVPTRLAALAAATRDEHGVTLHRGVSAGMSPKASLRKRTVWGLASTRSVSARKGWRSSTIGAYLQFHFALERLAQLTVPCAAHDRCVRLSQ